LIPWGGPVAEEKRGRPISGEGVPGGEGRGAREHKEVTAHLLEVLGGAGMARGGGAMGAGGRRRRSSSARVLRRCKEGMTRQGSFTRARIGLRNTLFGQN